MTQIIVDGMYNTLAQVEFQNGQICKKEDCKAIQDGNTITIKAHDVLWISTKELRLVKSIAWAWAKFETLRSEYELGMSDDYKYANEVIAIPKIYNYITEEEYNAYNQALKELIDANNYSYEELDDFIEQLNPIYKKF